MLASKCGPMHVRLMKIDDTKPQEEAKDLDDGEVYDENAPTIFEQKNIEKIQTIIQNGPQIMQDPLQDEELIERRTEYCQRKTKELNMDRYSCQICDKLFRAPHYVEKHILNKHESKLYSKVDKSRFDELMFENFIKNPSKRLSSNI